MDIASMSMALSRGKLKQQASLSVMKKAMDQAEENGDFINNMLTDTNTQVPQNTAEPHLGGNIDIKG